MASFAFNPLVERELALTPEMAAMLETKAKAAAVEARNDAPVGTGDDPHPGEFRDSIRGELAERDGLPVGRLLSDDPAAPYIIFGTSDTPPHDVFNRAIEATAAL